MFYPTRFGEGLANSNIAREAAIAAASAPLTEGSKVRCKAASIDRRIGDGETGTIGGFARFSPYHAREAMVHFSDGRSDWFWLRDLEGAN